MKKTIFLVMVMVAFCVTGCTIKSNEKKDEKSSCCGKEESCEKKACCGKETCGAKNLLNLANWEFILADNSVPACKVFSVEDGVISIKGEPLGYMYTNHKFGDYTLELEWRWAGEAGNSGIFVLIEEPNNPFPKGIEVQLKAGNAGDFVLLAGSDLKEFVLPEGVTERPKFPVIPKRQPSSEKPVGEWNKAKITVQDGVITAYINDVLQNVGTSTVKEGYIGLQSESKEIQFRNIVLQ